MEKKPKIEYAKNRWLNPEKIIDAAVYSKQSESADANGNYKIVWRIAFKVDVQSEVKQQLYSDPFDTEKEARDWLLQIDF